MRERSRGLVRGSKNRDAELEAGRAALSSVSERVSWLRRDQFRASTVYGCVTLRV
jgi:hypothetical protein